MRTGVIFARGSCRALAWVLALVAVAALSVGEAAAQAVPTPGLSPGSLTLDEGDSDTVTLSVANGTDDGSDDVTVSVESAEGGTFDLTWREAGTLESMSVVTGATSATISVPEGDTIRITATANDDDDADNARAVLSFTTGSGDSARSATLILRANDSDTSGVIVSERSLALHEGGSAETYTIRLGTAPSASVMVTASVTRQVNARIRLAKALVDDPTTDDVDESAKASSQTLTFTTTDWDVAQILYVTAEGDANTRNGSARITNKAASVDGDYSGVSGRNVEVMEYDSVRTITMSTSADTAIEGDDKIIITATLSAAGDTVSTLPVPVTVTLTKKGTTPPGSDYSLTALVIGANSTSGSADLMAEHDADANDEKLTLIASVDDDGTDSIFTEIVNEEFSITLEDDDTYTLEADKEEVAEGDKVTLTVEVDPKAAVETKVSIDLYRASGASVEPAEGQDADADGNAIIDIGEDSAEFTLTTAKDASDDNDEVIVARAMVGSSVIGEPVTINVLDTQASPEFTFTLEPTFIGEVDGEQSVMLMAMTNKAVTADTMVKFAVEADSTAMDPDDYTIMPESGMIELTVEKGMTSGMTELMVTPVMDSMDEPNEIIKLSGWVDDALVGNYVNLTIIDGDSPGSGITPKSSDGVAMVFSDAIEMAGGLMVGGNMVSVDMSMLFNMANPDMKVMYTASSSDESVLEVSTTESMLMLSPMMMGMSTVSVMAEPADGGTGASAVAVFSCSGACVSVNLDVMGAITFMLADPEDMNLAEGMSAAKVMVTASSAVVADTEVSLMRDGTSTASMDDYSVEPMMATIMAGETMAEFEVMATEDEMMEEAEMLTLFLVVDDMQMTDQSVSFYLWDAAVPALPVIAQFLLAALMAIGGYRRYRRR